MRTGKRTLVLVFLILLMVCGAIAYQLYETSPGVARLSAVALLSNDQPLHLDARTKETGCQVDGALPDHECSPGAVFPDATLAQICASGYAKSVRNVSVALKRRVYAEYGLTYPQPTGDYEVDHIIPLEAGGSNDIANLYPEAAAPTPGFHEKDLVENYIHQKACAGKISLTTAQQQIADNWLAIYQALTPDELAALKAQVSSYYGN